MSEQPHRGWEARRSGFGLACVLAVVGAAALAWAGSAHAGAGRSSSAVRAAADRLGGASAMADAVVDVLGGHRDAGGGVTYEQAWRARTGRAALATHEAAHTHGRSAEDDRRAARQGLVPAPAGSACGALYEVHVAGGTTCSHGDDAALAGSPPLFGRAGSATAAAEAAGAGEATRTCIGDGTSGNRVQLMYVRRSNQTDRSAAADTQLKAWSTTIDEAMMLSARQTGGARRVRWATDATCTPTVVNAVVGTSATDFSTMVSALLAAGYKGANRKYLVATDIGSYCGLGEVISDGSPGAGNANNGGTRALFASVAPSCWTDTVAAHELMHTLGAVQSGAPNASAYGHCTDGAELMCYVDGPGTVVRSVCPASNADYYDCRHDDYFSTSPPAGSYLATHWNTASSSFLDATGSLSPPFSPASPKAVGRTGSAQVTWATPLFDGGAPITGYVVTASPGGATASVGPTARTATVAPLADGTSYTFTVQAMNSEGLGNPSDAAGPVTPTPTITLRHEFTGEYPVGLGALGADAYTGTGADLLQVSADGTRTDVAGGFDPLAEPPADGTPAATTRLQPVDVAVHPTTGDLWFSDGATNRIRRITGGKVYTAATGPAGFSPGRIAFDPSGNLYVVDDVQPRVWKVAASGGAVSAFAGGTTAGFSGDGGAATAAKLSSPRGIAADASGNVYVADYGNNRVRRITAAGVISTFFGEGHTYVMPDGGLATATAAPFPLGVAWGNNRLYVETAGAIRAIGSDGRVTTWVGTMGSYGSTGDGGPASAALIDYTDDIAVGAGHLLLLQQAGSANRLRDVGAPTTVRPTAPAAPPAVTATAGRESATVRWVPPGNGGTALTSLVVVTQPGGVAHTVAPGATSLVVTGLTAGVTYTFEVKAVNAVGTGPVATSNAVAALARPLYDPFGSWAAFVKQQYVDFAGRAPTAAEASAGAAALSGGATTPAAFVQGLSQSNAFAGSYGPVTRLYFAYFLRAPDKGGLDYWVSKVRAGTALGVVSQSFASSAEFKAKYGSLTNHQFVVKVYENVLGRVGDTSGIDYWAGELDKGRKTRGQVMVGFSESAEYKKVRAAEISTILVFRGMLQRVPTAGEFDATVARLKGGTPLTTVIGELLRSASYAARITP